jgi:hypothetical protein
MTTVILVLLSISPVLSDYNVTVKFWLDRGMTVPYIDQFMTVYFQNKTFVNGQLDYTRYCYLVTYYNGDAVIPINQTGYYDLLITDGAVSVDNSTGCPSTNENYNFWSTVQSNMYLHQADTYNYFINITMRQTSPNQYFWNTINVKAIFSILYFIIAIGITAFIGKFSQSGIVALLTFIVLIIIKLIIGI